MSADQGDDYPAVSQTTIINITARSVPVATKAGLVILAGSHIGELHDLEEAEVVLGRDPGCGITIMDEGISRRHCCFRREGSDIYLADLDSTNGTWIDGERIVGRWLRNGDRIRVGQTTTMRFMLQDADEEAYHRDLYEAAVRDALTGLFNKRFFNDRLVSEVAFSLRHDEPLTLVLFDVDHFKSVNDTFGHPAGDAVLTAIASQVEGMCRRDDIVARFGGDEFAIISRGLSEAGGHALAERLRLAVAREAFAFDGQHIPITLSMGVAAVEDGFPGTPDALVTAADQALYVAKREGRNGARAFRADVRRTPASPRASSARGTLKAVPAREPEARKTA